MKIENENISISKKKFYKLIVETEEKDFAKIVKKLQNEPKKKYSVYAIAAKIARGETVSAEELTYIRENAPSLLAEAQRQNEDRKEAERGEKHILKQEKSIKTTSGSSKDSIKAESTAVKTEENKATLPVINSNINIGL